MFLYFIFYIISFFIFVSTSVYSIANNKDDRQSYLFYFLSIIIILLALPIYYFMFESYQMCTFLSLLLLFLNVIFSQRMYSNNKKSLLSLLPFNYFLYFTFCFLLATDLIHR